MSTDANSVLGKARLILECVASGDAEPSLAEISRRTGIAKPTVHRLNRQLLEWGLLERSGQEYRLGLRAFELGGRVPRLRVLRAAIRPYLHSLRLATEETVDLAVLDGREVLDLERAGSPRQAATSSPTPGRRPVHATATGKVLLAHSPPELVDAVLMRGLEQVTPLTVTSPQLLRDQLVRARHDGYATEVEEAAAGHCSVAVPIFGPTGLLLAALSVTSPAGHGDPERYAGMLAAVGREVSADRSVT
ncbi:IclR family transcriptional regulator [Nocardioides nitrophenolicus]|uniref:IclR family transcriptional regulator n=1 Tax=Nocardioides nitrophenolicus TaxID=60489 RepID=UPI0019598C1C|nr:IclR family transcriptional regulator [Nocardioides nitrophenolicus]MBM7517501.1 DNA-binding IclR family transcriptional regulator [Nocardioides nitrophenolicus]